MTKRILSDRVNVIFGQKLASIRKSKFFTQEDLAHLVGVSRVTIANIEGAKQNVQLAQVYSFSLALNVAPGDLLPTSLELERLANGAQAPEDVFKNTARLRLSELILRSSR